MENDWDHHMLYELSQSVAQDPECITIDDDIGEDAEEVYFQIESEEFVLPLSADEVNSQSTSGFTADDESIEDYELEVIFDNTAMPPLIPLSAPGQVLARTATKKARSSYQMTQVESSLEILVKELQSSLECPVCFTIIRTSPVNSCSNGHLICLSCLTRCHVCPVCRVPCHAVPPCYSQLANRIIDLIPLPCANSERGCPEVAGRAEIEIHHLVCPLGVVEDRSGGCSDIGCTVGHSM